MLRLALTRFVPFSYFCSCWNVTPSASATFVWDISYRFQITLNARRHRRHYPNTVRRGRIRFKPIWDRYQASGGALIPPAVPVGNYTTWPCVWKRLPTACNGWQIWYPGPQSLFCSRRSTLRAHRSRHRPRNSACEMFAAPALKSAHSGRPSNRSRHVSNGNSIIRECPQLAHETASAAKGWRKGWRNVLRF
jgi:hypothetical protein